MTRERLIYRGVIVFLTVLFCLGATFDNGIQWRQASALWIYGCLLVELLREERRYG